MGRGSGSRGAPPKTRSRELGIKMRRNAPAGVPHYWIIDPRAKTLTSCRLTRSGYRRTGACGPGAVFQPERFPALEIPIDDLWS